MSFTRPLIYTRAILFIILSYVATLALPLHREETEIKDSQRPSTPPEEIEVSCMSKHRETQWAIGLATTVSAVVVLSGAIFGIAYLAGGSNAVSDNWVGFLVAISFLAGLLVSLLAFILAVTAWIRHGRAAWLWVPLAVFPALLAFIVIGETFWWE